MRHLLVYVVAIAMVMMGCRAQQSPPAAPQSSLVRVEVVAGTGGSLPLVVAMHGLGDRAAAYAPLFDAYPGKARVIVAQAPTAHGQGWSWFATRVREGEAEVVAAEVATAADEVAVLLRELMHRYPDAGKPVVTGFSQGAMMSIALAVRHPELVSRAVAVAGWLPEPLWPKALPKDAPPIVALHGDGDTVLPIERTRRGIEALGAQGWDAELVVYPGVSHHITPQMRARMYAEIGR